MQQRTLTHDHRGNNTVTYACDVNSMSCLGQMKALLYPGWVTAAHHISLEYADSHSIFDVIYYESNFCMYCRLLANWDSHYSRVHCIYTAHNYINLILNIIKAGNKKSH